MEFLADAYDSDDDSKGRDVAALLNLEQKASTPPNAASRPLGPAYNATKLEVPKPKKKLDISFLPQHIQDALLRGDKANDRDSDDDGDALPQPKLGKTVDSTSGKSSNPLLNMLPAPKNNHKPNDDVFSASKTKSVSSDLINNSLKPTMAKDASDDQDYLSTVNYEISSAAATSDRKFSNEAHSISHVTHALPAIPTISLNSNYSTFVQDQYQMPPPFINVQSHYPPSRELRSAEELEEPAPKNRKKRERELEALLMAGDLSALNEAKVANIQGFNSWDSRTYMDQQARESSIIKQYTGGPEGNKSMLQPNKVQNRKHQLTSLAMRAAETEIALLEARGARMKTKSQTQSKYGW